MPKDELFQNWEKIKIKIKEKFNKLSDEDLEKIKGKKEALINLIEKKHGLTRDKATEILRHIEDSLQLAGVGGREHPRDREAGQQQGQRSPHESRETRYQDQNPRSAQKQPRDTQRGMEDSERSEHHPFGHEQQGGKGRW